MKQLLPDLALLIVGWTIGYAIHPIPKIECPPVAAFYLEPHVHALQRDAPATRKSQVRVLETSLIGGPWENQ